MKKRLLTLLLVAALTMSMFAGCGKKEESKDPVENNTATEENKVDDAAQDGDKEEKQEPTLDEIVAAVKEAYGEDYIPSMEIPSEQLSDVFGINMDDVDSFYAEGPMISAHVDTFIALKAKEGKVDSLVESLNTYRQNQINSAYSYPMNILRLQGSKVMKNGDYAFFVLLGAFPDEEMSEEDQVKFTEEQVQIGVDAINALF